MRVQEIKHFRFPYSAGNTFTMKYVEEIPSWSVHVECVMSNGIPISERAKKK
jgi:hypothetical protein